MQRTAALKIADILMTILIVLVIGVLFSWWVGTVVFLLGLLIVLRRVNRRYMPVSPTTIPLDEKNAGIWLEEWHDDMRCWQIGPYDQQD